MASKKGIVAIASVLIVGFVYWYYFVDTLKLTEITGKPNNAVAGFFVNLIDFDTGLTHCDIYNLKSKTSYWENRIQEVASITDSKRREIEHEKLVAEMMQDPSMKKIVKKIFGFGTDSILTVLKAVSSF